MCAISPAILYNKVHMGKKACSDQVVKTTHFKIFGLTKIYFRLGLPDCIWNCPGDTCKVTPSYPQGPSPLLVMLFPLHCASVPPAHSRSFIQKVYIDLLANEEF